MNEQKTPRIYQVVTVQAHRGEVAEVTTMITAEVVEQARDDAPLLGLILDAHDRQLLADLGHVDAGRRSGAVMTNELGQPLFSKPRDESEVFVLDGPLTGDRWRLPWRTRSWRMLDAEGIAHNYAIRRTRIGNMAIYEGTSRAGYASVPSMTEPGR